MFQAVTGIPEYDDMVRKIHSDMMDKSDVYKTTFTQLSKDMKGMGEPEFSKIQDYMYGKDLNPAPAIQKVGDNLKVFFKSLADEAIDKQYMKGIVDNYMPGILTSDAMKVIKEFGTIKGIRPTELTKSINFA